MEDRKEERIDEQSNALKEGQRRNEEMSKKINTPKSPAGYFRKQDNGEIPGIGFSPTDQNPEIVEAAKQWKDYYIVSPSDTAEAQEFVRQHPRLELEERLPIELKGIGRIEQLVLSSPLISKAKKADYLRRALRIIKHMILTH